MPTPPTRSPLPPKIRRAAHQAAHAMIAVADSLDATPEVAKVVAASVVFVHFSTALVTLTTEKHGDVGHAEALRSVREILRSCSESLDDEIEFHTVRSHSNAAN
jgi:hypothetical protein